MISFSLLGSARKLFTLSLILGISLVAGGVMLSELLHLAACPLCIIQRMLYLILALLAMLGLLFASGPLRRIIGPAMIVAAGTGIFVAGYQVWIQRFSPTTTCASDMPWWEQLVEWAGTQLPLLFAASGLCSDPAWHFLGLSIAEWSLGCFTLFLVFATAATFAKR